MSVMKKFSLNQKIMGIIISICLSLVSNAQMKSYNFPLIGVIDTVYSNPSVSTSQINKNSKLNISNELSCMKTKSCCNNFFDDLLEGTGIQTGASWRTGRFTQYELGINIHYLGYDGISGIGPVFNITGLHLFKDGSFSIGQKVSIDCHELIGFIQYRVCPSFENLRNKDFRIGADLGLSFLGYFLYVGYYEPVGKFELEEVPRFRFGFAYILNLAGSDDWGGLGY